MFAASRARRVVVGLCVVALLIAAALPGGVGHGGAVLPSPTVLDAPCLVGSLVPRPRQAATPWRLARTSRPRAPPVG